jgi:hypothetical protein
MDKLLGPTPIEAENTAMPEPRFQGELGVLENSIIELEITSKNLNNDLQRLNFK